MSAGSNDAQLRVSRDLQLLAPKFREAVEHAIAECTAKGFKARVFEAYRTPELQALYYAKGRTLIPPTSPVTYAPTSLYSWHGYGLAVDVIHEDLHWGPGQAWFEAVAGIFKSHQCKWGGDWTRPDLPHFQWHLCRPSPSPRARELIVREGREEVWKVVGSI